MDSQQKPRIDHFTSPSSVCSTADLSADQAPSETSRPTVFGDQVKFISRLRMQSHQRPLLSDGLRMEVGAASPGISTEVRRDPMAGWDGRRIVRRWLTIAACLFVGANALAAQAPEPVRSQTPPAVKAPAKVPARTQAPAQSRTQLRQNQAPAATQAQGQAPAPAPTPADSQPQLPVETQAPAQSAVAADYIIGPGDTIQVFVWRNPELTTTVPVRPDGRVSTPLVEDMVAVCKTPSELARNIETVLGEYVRSPQVNVIVTQPASAFSQVKVIGQVMRPMSIPYRDGLTVLDAVLAVGGLGPFAAGNRAKVVRTENGKQQEIKVKLASLVNSGDMRQNIPLRPGDVIVVPESRF